VELLGRLQGVQIDPLARDEVFWILDKSTTKTDKSSYRLLTFGGVVSREASRVWKCKIPPKIKFFSWQIANCICAKEEGLER
jgi:hypothetical protein